MTLMLTLVHKHSSAQLVDRMFVLKSLTKLILGNTEQRELLQLPSGTLWRVKVDVKSGKELSREQ